MKDVAAAAGVSVTTVSLVLGGKAGSSIPEQTRQRVLAAVDELGYLPNALASGLRRRASETIGFVSDEIATTPFAGAMIQGAQDAAAKAGKVLVMINTGRDEQVERQALDALISRQVEGLIYAAMYHQVVDPPAAVRRLPSVLLDARVADGSLPSVVPDEATAARTAVERLLREGHSRVGYVQNSMPIPAAVERHAGWRRELEAHGLDTSESLVAAASSDTSGGLEAASSLLALPRPPTALFCFNDQMAMGAYRAVRYLQLTIPEDLSIVGFDNLGLIAPWLDPGLTTMELPHYEMGRIAVELLLDRIAGGGEPTNPQLRVTCPLIERGSVGPPPVKRGRSSSSRGHPAQSVPKEAT